MADQGIAETSQLSDAQRRTAPAARGFDNGARRVAGAIGTTAGEGVNVVTDLAKRAGDALADTDATGKKSKGLFDGMTMPGIAGAIGVALLGGMLVNTIGGDIFGGGIISTLLSFFVGLMLLPMGYDIGNGLFGGKKAEAKVTPAPSPEKQPQIFTTPQIQALLDEAKGAGKRKDVLKIVNVAGKPLSLATVAEGEEVESQLLLRRDTIEQLLLACKTGNQNCDFALLPAKDGYSFGTVPVGSGSTAKPAAGSTKAAAAPGAGAAGDVPRLPESLTLAALEAMRADAPKLGHDTQKVEVYGVDGTNQYGVRSSNPNDGKQHSGAVEVTELMKIYNACNADTTKYQPNEIRFVPHDGGVRMDCVAPRGAAAAAGATPTR